MQTALYSSLIHRGSQNQFSTAKNDNNDSDNNDNDNDNKIEKMSSSNSTPGSRKSATSKGPKSNTSTPIFTPQMQDAQARNKDPFDERTSDSSASNRYDRCAYFSNVSVSVLKPQNLLIRSSISFAPMERKQVEGKGSLFGFF